MAGRRWPHGQAIYQLDPSFDPRTYGHKQLSRMIAKLKDRFEIRTQEVGGHERHVCEDEGVIAIYYWNRLNEAFPVERRQRQQENPRRKR